MKFQAAIGRIKHIFPDIERAFFLAAMRAVERALKPLAKKVAEGDLVSRLDDATSIARMVLVSEDSSLQWFSVSGGISDDPEWTLESIYFDKKIVSGKADEIVFKRAWKNGVWHACELLSFDLGRC